MYWDEITLTPEEIESALIEGKKRKFFRLRNADYWIQQEQNAVDAHEEEKRLKRASGGSRRVNSSGSAQVNNL